jgi:prepilin-type N-terminal cleavage/methylation domain-containing protein
MKRRGFSLLEVLIATALVGLVMVGLYTLMFSMTELWGVTHPQRQFEQHVETMTRYLGQALRTAALPPYGTTTTVSPYNWTIPSSGTGATSAASSNPLFSFVLPPGSRLLPWPPGTTGGTSAASTSNVGSASSSGRALPDVYCSLQVREGEGLILLWHSQYETTFTTDPPRETLISPLVTEMDFDYYDPSNQQWTSQNTPLTDNNGNYMVPNRLRLNFAYESITQSATIPLLTATQGLPSF